jgi:hypothetical protein
VSGGGTLVTTSLILAEMHALLEVMRRRKLRRALAVDQHFVVAGVDVLP